MNYYIQRRIVIFATLFSRINPYLRGEVTLTAAEFALFFEGADLEKRFIDSPSEIQKQSSRKSLFSVSQELRA